jgi:hypothetical protein
VSWRLQLAALAVAAALAVFHTWPLSRDLAGQSRLDNADTALTTWITSWVAHQLPRDPLHLFDAPIFHPERRTLAYSEPLIAPGVMAIPLRGAGLSATTTYNLLVLAGYALSAWAMWRLVTGWTGDPVAGAVAGCAFAFNAHLLTRFAHLQALHGEFVPVVLLAMDRLATRARWRDAVLLAAGLVLVGLTSIYTLTFAAAAVVVGVAARAAEWRATAARTWLRVGAGALLGALCLSPVLLQYWLVNRELGLERTLADSAQYGATWRDYLATGGRLHYNLWSARFFSGTAVLFPGVAALGLALVGIADRRGHRGRVRMFVAIGVLGVVLSLGPAVPLYGWLFETVPLLRATRVAARWGGLFLMAVAVLAGFGTAALRARSGPRAAWILAWLLPAVVTLEAARTPMAFTPTPPIPLVYSRLAALPDAVLLEFPLFPGPQFNLNAPYLLAQTEHFHPIIAGYSGFATPAYTARTATLGRFPADESRALMRALGVTHVVLHLGPLVQGYGQAAVDAIDGVPWLRREYADDEARVYRVVE